MDRPLTLFSLVHRQQHSARSSGGCGVGAAALEAVVAALWISPSAALGVRGGGPWFSPSTALEAVVAALGFLPLLPLEAVVAALDFFFLCYGWGRGRPV